MMRNKIGKYRGKGGVRFETKARQRKKKIFPFLFLFSYKQQ